MSDLLELFTKINKIASDGKDIMSFSAMAVPGFKDRHLGRDANDSPVILLKTEMPKKIPANYALENLRVEYCAECRIIDSKGNESRGVFTIICCLSDDDGLKAYFLRVMDSIINALPSDIKNEDISYAIDRLAALFLALKKPRSKPVRGLWAELFLINSAKNPYQMLEAWHNDLSEHFDFSQRASRIEVKSTGDRIRDHYFSLEQVYPAAGVSVVIASLFVEECTNGCSLSELWDKARQAAKNNLDLRLKVDKICVETLGSDWEQARSLSYDMRLAKQSLKFYRVEDIPKVSDNLPSGVSEVRFRSDLSGVTALDIDSSSNGYIYIYYGKE
ncbi:MAG TPA: PD-(D/E)XK motif protein [archaeon]|nr:PD-(D/E)XK motif protein [archaeon]